MVFTTTPPLERLLLDGETKDIDAIIAGAPANFQTHLHAWDLTVAVPALKKVAPFTGAWIETPLW